MMTMTMRKAEDFIGDYITMLHDVLAVECVLFRSLSLTSVCDFRSKVPESASKQREQNHKYFIGFFEKLSTRTNCV